MLYLKDIDLRGRRVLVRADLNVGMRGGEILSAARIDEAMKTINFVRAAGGRVLVMSHLGRPEEGAYDDGYSLATVADYIGGALGGAVGFSRDYLARAPGVGEGEVAVLENVRFNVGEAANDDSLARAYAGLGDVFVMDAFGAAHRRQASTFGVIGFARVACGGILLAEELAALGKVRDLAARPVVAIIGGAKVSGKLAAMKALARRVDFLIPGGGIANTFLAADFGVGASLYEADLVEDARRMMADGEAKIVLPDDVVVSDSADGAAVAKAVGEVGDGEMILDIGMATVGKYKKIISQAETIIWNGPLGMFEQPQFAHGTQAIAEAIGGANCYAVAGGGETLAAIEKFIAREGLSYLSTGGGAFLEYLEGKTLPAVAALAAADSES